MSMVARRGVRGLCLGLIWEGREGGQGIGTRTTPKLCSDAGNKQGPTGNYAIHFRIQVRGETGNAAGVQPRLFIRFIPWTVQFRLEFSGRLRGYASWTAFGWVSLGTVWIAVDGHQLPTIEAKTGMNRYGRRRNDRRLQFEMPGSCQRGPRPRIFNQTWLEVSNPGYGWDHVETRGHYLTISF